MAVNVFDIKGQVTSVKPFKSENDDIPRMNVTIKTRENNEDKYGQYVQVVVTGQDKIDVFTELNKGEDIAVKGRAHFYDYTKDGVKNFNVSLLANEFKIAEANDLTNNLKINGTLGNNDIKVLQNKTGGEFAAFQMAHNEFYNKTQQPASWLNIVIPSEIMPSVDTDAIKATKPVIIEAKYQQRSYEQNGKKVYTLNLIANKVELNLLLDQNKKTENTNKKNNENKNEMTQ